MNLLFEKAASHTVLKEYRLQQTQPGHQYFSGSSTACFATYAGDSFKPFFCLHAVAAKSATTKNCVTPSCPCSSDTQNNIQ